MLQPQIHREPKHPQHPESLRKSLGHLQPSHNAQVERSNHREQDWDAN